MEIGDSSNSSEPTILNEGILPVELQTHNIVNPVYQPIVPSVVSNGTVNAGIIHKGEPYATIVEQPQQRGFRFRYECEGPSHGGLQGTKSERSKKSYPTIKIENYSGAARVLVTLVTDEKTPRCHAHKLVGTNCKNGQGTMEIQANSDPISFPNLCILHVTRKKLVDVLTERIVGTMTLNEKLKVNNINFEPTITDKDRQLARSQAKEQSKHMQLNVVRLCFQVFLRNPDGSFGKMLPPIVSQPIYDSKSPGASALKICRMDKYGGCCSGNEEVFLLCEKVQKDDIQVRFVEQGPDGKVKWESYGNFGPLDVHRQFAIVFKTPAYWNTNIEKAVNVMIMLQRRSDHEVSEPIAFTYFPQIRDKDNIASKKRKRIPLDGYDFGGDGGGFGGDFGGGGSGGGGGGHDMDGGGSVGGGPIGDSRIPSQLIVMQNRESSMPTTLSLQAHSHQAMPHSRSPVEQDVRSKTSTLPVINPVSPHQPPSPGSDLWVENSPALEIQVESAGPVSTASSVSRDDCFSITDSSHSIPLPSPTRQTRLSVSSEDDKEKTAHVSCDWQDSGVEFISQKSLLSDRLSTSSSSSGSKSHGRTNRESDDKKTSKPSSTVGSQTESDVRKDSVTIKSDEGFSESSVEAALKSKTKSLPDKNGADLSPSAKKVTDVTGAEFSKALRLLTENITDRTISALRDYAETGNILHLLLVQRHLLAVSNDNGDLPLHLSIINSQIESVRNILRIMGTLPQLKTYVNTFNFMRQTPLHLASILGQHRVVEMLLHAGADPSSADRNGNTAAHLAVMNTTEECLASLIKYIQPDTDKLDPFPELNHLNYEGFSPAHLAAMTGSVSMLRRLVFGQADVDLPDGKSGKTALHHAVDNNDLGVARYLLMDNLCDVNARCFDGNTALHIACARQKVAMVALLVSSGADVDIENEEIPEAVDSTHDRRGHTPMDYADGNEKILSILYKDCDEMESLCFGQDQVESVDKGMAQLSVDSARSLGTEVKEQDLKCLSLRVRMELSRLMDSSHSDLMALAAQLPHSNLATILPGIIKSHDSPTAFVLEYLESHREKLKTLEDGLKAIGREDAISVIHQSLV